MLDEFHLAEKLDADRDAGRPEGEDSEAHLKLTDDEEGESEAGDVSHLASPGAAPRREPRPFPAYDESKHTPENTLKSHTTGATDSVGFLSHAFPTRTANFLREILSDCQDDVGGAIDTLMAIDLAEREAVESVNEVPGPAAANAKKGLDYEALAGGSKAGHVKGKKGRSMRKKAEQEYLRSVGQDTAPVKGPKTKVTLGDVRQGAGLHDVARGKKPLAQGRSGGNGTPSSGPRSADASFAAELNGLSDYEIAQRLAKEEDPDAGEAVRDNQWLLTSSVLSQMSTLLEVDPMAVTSTYNKSSFNLHIAVGRLIDSSATAYPSLQSLEEAGGAPQGTAKALADSLSALSGKSVEMTSLCLRATKGRQDATLDLLNLLDVVKEATTSEVPDELDPLGRLRGDLGEDAADKKRESAKAESSQRGVTVEAGGQDPLPSESSGLNPRTLHNAQRGGKFARAAVAGQQAANAQPTGQAKAMAALNSPAQAAVSFPPSAGAVGHIPTATQLMFSGGGSGSTSASATSTTAGFTPRTIREKEDAIKYYKSLAAEYQQRRDDCLTQASSAWRTSNTRNKSAAFYYADEARRLDLKSRAFNLKASQALVDFRKANRGEDVYTTTANAGSRSGVVDLHGVTVREALSIVQDELNEWWSLPSSASSSRKSLTIITGAGKHSPGQVAILTPSVAKFLQREGWRADVDRSRGVIIVRGR